MFKNSYLAFSHEFPTFFQSPKQFSLTVVGQNNFGNKILHFLVSPEKILSKILTAPKKGKTSKIMTHYIRLKHYCSLDFPLWFDRKNLQRILHSSISKKIVKSDYKEGYFNDLTEFLFVFALFWKKHVSKTFRLIWRPNAWMNPSNFCSLLQSN